MDYARGFWTIKGIENIIWDMKIGEELYFTLDTPEDLETQEPLEWYGMKKDIVFDGDVLMIGYMGGGDTTLYNLYLNDDDTCTKKSIGCCIRSYLKNYLHTNANMLYIEYEKRGKKGEVG